MCVTAGRVVSRLHPATQGGGTITIRQLCLRGTRPAAEQEKRFAGIRTQGVFEGAGALQCETQGNRTLGPDDIAIRIATDQESGNIQARSGAA